MYDFFNNNANDQHEHQHEHEHGTAGSDVDTEDDNSPNSGSKHDEERSHHKQEKEPKEMNRIAKNTSAPILTGFTLSMILILGSAFNAPAFDKSAFNGYGLDNVFAIADFQAPNLNFGRFNQNFKDDANVRFNNDQNFDANIREFDRAKRVDNVDFENASLFDLGNMDFVRFNFNPINDGNAELSGFDVNSPFRFSNASFTSFNKDRLADFADGKPDVVNDFKTSRLGDNGNRFNGFEFEVTA